MTSRSNVVSLRDAELEWQKRNRSYRPDFPWKRVLAIVLLCGAALAAYVWNERRSADKVRDAVLSTYEGELQPLVVARARHQAQWVDWLTLALRHDDGAAAFVAAKHPAGAPDIVGTPRTDLATDRTLASDQPGQEEARSNASKARTLKRAAPSTAAMQTSAWVAEGFGRAWFKSREGGYLRVRLPAEETPGPGREEDSGQKDLDQKNLDQKNLDQKNLDQRNLGQKDRSEERLRLLLQQASTDDAIAACLGMQVTSMTTMFQEHDMLLPRWPASVRAESSVMRLRVFDEMLQQFVLVHKPVLESLMEDLAFFWLVIEHGEGRKVDPVDVWVFSPRTGKPLFAQRIRASQAKVIDARIEDAGHERTQRSESGSGPVDCAIADAMWRSLPP